MGARFRAAVVLTCFASIAATPPAHAAFPGLNGRIVYSKDPSPVALLTVNSDGSDQATTNRQGFTASWSPNGKRIVYRAIVGGVVRNLSVMNPDGSGNVDLGVSGEYPTWSPDQAKIAFAAQGCCPLTNNIYVMNADGSGVARLPLGDASSTSVNFPSWSPDGAWIAFAGQPSAHPSGVYKVRPDGSDLTLLFQGGGDPDWSPDGSRIAFTRGSDLATIDAEGGGFTVVDSPTDGFDIYPAWSPDATKIVFTVAPTAGGLDKVYVINADGTGRSFLGVNGYQPSWQPLGYPRPKGATPMRASLVPAYQPCSSANSTHGSPLAYPSCAPPVQASGRLTVGTPPQDPANSIGSVIARVITGDVQFDVSVTDVRNQGSLTDYGGELQSRLPLRVTDRDGGMPATTQDFPFSFAVPCATTTDTSVGSTCSVVTTADTLAPGAITAGLRTIWALGQIGVYDGGADGLASTTADNTPFMDQGIFVP